MKRLMENQNKSSFVQWIVPFAVPMVVVLLILFSFSVRSNARAEEAIAEEMMMAAQRYRESLAGQLETISSVVVSVRTVVEQDLTLSDMQTAALLGIVRDCTEASRVELCDREGNGINQSGEAISVGEAAYFQRALSSDEALFYVEEKEAAVRKSIVVVERISREDRNLMLIFYPVEKFDGVLSAKDQDAGIFLTLLDTEGNVLSASGKDSEMFGGINLIEALRAENPDEADRIAACALQGLEGMEQDVEAGGRKRTLIYVPLGINQWSIVMGVPQTYVDRLISRQWESTKNMLIALILVTLVFSCIVTAVDIIGRIRDNQQKKELENKADTDLLTGLNNKLATERKIKTYMAQNPQTQSMMFLLDVDNFKTVNDTMGHAFGDEVLSTLGEEISAIFRASDIIGRVGGDEFMIFLKAVPTTEIIRREAKKVEDFFRSFQVGDPVRYDVRASIGVAIFPYEGNDFETLYKAADQGLYKAKRRGKNQLAFYEDKWGESEEMQGNQK